MDRQRLGRLTVQAGALQSELNATSDSNANAKQLCRNFAAELKSLVQAWNNLARSLHDAQLEQRAAFNQILDIVLSDNVKIIDELYTSLSKPGTRHAQYETASRSRGWRVAPIRKVHILGSFLERKNTTLRMLQVRYAISVLDILSGVVLYARTLGNEHDHHQPVLHDQLERLKRENEAKALVFGEECRIGDKLVVSSMWLQSVEWESDSSDDLPFETLALQWFDVVDPDIVQERPSGETVGTDNLVRIVQQMRLEMQQQQQQIQANKQQTMQYRAWADSTIKQLELSQQKTAQDAAAKIEGLRSQLEVQRQQIQSDSAMIEQLKYSRNEWATNYQKQAERSQNLEKQMKELEQNYVRQQEKLDGLQQSYRKLYEVSTRLQQQNRALQQKLGETETERQALEREHNNLQRQYEKAVQHNQQWQDFHESETRERDTQIEAHHRKIEDLEAEIDRLRNSRAKVAQNRDDLHKKLTRTEGERDTERLRANRLQERLATRQSTGPNAYPSSPMDRSSGTSSGTSRSRHPSSTRANSRNSQSRPSSATSVDDSDHEYYEQNLPRRFSGGNGTSRIGSLFTIRARPR